MDYVIGIGFMVVYGWCLARLLVKAWRKRKAAIRAMEHEGSQLRELEELYQLDVFPK